MCIRDSTNNATETSTGTTKLNIFKIPIVNSKDKLVIMLISPKEMELRLFPQHIWP